MAQLSTLSSVTVRIITHHLMLFVTFLVGVAITSESIATSLASAYLFLTFLGIFVFGDSYSRGKRTLVQRALWLFASIAAIVAFYTLTAHVLNKAFAFSVASITENWLVATVAIVGYVGLQLFAMDIAAKLAPTTEQERAERQAIEEEQAREESSHPPVSKRSFGLFIIGSSAFILAGPLLLKFIASGDEGDPFQPVVTAMSDMMWHPISIVMVLMMAAAGTLLLVTSGDSRTPTPDEAPE